MLCVKGNIVLHLFVVESSCLLSVLGFENCSLFFSLASKDKQMSTYNKPQHLMEENFLGFLLCHALSSLLRGSRGDGKVNCPLVFSKEPWVPGHRPRLILKGCYLPIVWDKATHPQTCRLFTPEHSLPTHCLFLLSELSTCLSQK